MDINEGVPLPKKLTTPLPELPKMIPPADLEPAKGVELPKKLTTPLPDKLERPPEVKVAFMPLPTRDNLSEFDRQFKASAEAAAKVDAQLPGADRNRKYVPVVPTSVRIEPVTIKRPVEESARLAGGGFDLSKIKRAMDNSEDSMFETAKKGGVSLPPKLRAYGNREEKTFEPAGSSIPTFVAVDNTQIKLSEKLTGPKIGSLQVAKCGVAFEAPKMGEPMMRRVKIVWPKPMEKAPAKVSGPFLGTAGVAGDVKGLKPNPPATFPNQTLPLGAQQVQIQVTEQPKLGVPSQKFAGLQDPPPSPRRPATSSLKGDDETGKSAEMNREIKKMVEDSLAAARARLSMVRERVAAGPPEDAGQVAELKAENEALREAVKTLGGKVALYEAEIQILKAKKG